MLTVGPDYAVFSPGLDSDLDSDKNQVEALSAVLTTRNWLSYGFEDLAMFHLMGLYVERPPVTICVQDSNDEKIGSFKVKAISANSPAAGEMSTAPH